MWTEMEVDGFRGRAEGMEGGAGMKLPEMTAMADVNGFMVIMYKENFYADERPFWKKGHESIFWFGGVLILGKDPPKIASGRFFLLTGYDGVTLGF